MERIIKPSHGTYRGCPMYRFYGDYVKGRWIGRYTRLYPQALESMPNIYFLPEVVIKGIAICWPFIKENGDNYTPLRYVEPKNSISLSPK